MRVAVWYLTVRKVLTPDVCEWLQKLAIDHVKTRQAFGRPLSDLQNVQFKVSIARSADSTHTDLRFRTPFLSLILSLSLSLLPSSHLLYLAC